MAAEPRSPHPTIRAGISYELGTNGFDPMTTTSALTVAANWHTMEGLTEILPSGNRDVYAALGKDLPKKVDDLTYEVTLRDGAVFHNNSPVTTDDVVYSFERVLDPANKSLYAQFITFLDKVEKKDDKTVTIRLKYPFSLVAERIAVVKIVPKAAATADPKAFDANPVGTGPYKMIDNSATSKQVVFEKFAAYTGTASGEGELDDLEGDAGRGHPPQRAHLQGRSGDRPGPRPVHRDREGQRHGRVGPGLRPAVRDVQLRIGTRSTTSRTGRASCGRSTWRTS